MLLSFSVIPRNRIRDTNLGGSGIRLSNDGPLCKTILPTALYQLTNIAFRQTPDDLSAVTTGVPVVAMRAIIRDELNRLPCGQETVPYPVSDCRWSLTTQFVSTFIETSSARE